MPWRENKGVANLNGIYTEFIELLRKKSLEEIFFKEWPEARNVMDPRSGGHGFF